MIDVDFQWLVDLHHHRRKTNQTKLMQKQKHKMEMSGVYCDVCAYHRLFIDMGGKDLI